MSSITSWCAETQGEHLTKKEFKFEKQLGFDEVEVDITHCGICHTDIEMNKNSMGNSRYPLISGNYRYINCDLNFLQDLS